MSETNRRRAVVLDPKTIELIEKVVHDEARGESVEGRNAVRAVIYNRIAANRRDFGGNTVQGVLNKKGQFQGVWQKAKGDASRLPLPDEVRDQYVQEHLNFLKSGEDPTNGATFFLNPDIAQRPFNQGQEGIRVGNHVFFDNYNGNKVEVPSYQVALRGFKQDLTKAALSNQPPTTTAAKATPTLTPFSGEVRSLRVNNNPVREAGRKPPVFTPYDVPLAMGREAKAVQNFAEGGMPSGYLRYPERQEQSGSLEGLSTAADIATDFIPIVGETKSAIDAYDQFQQGNYGSAALSAVGALPFVGMVGRGAKAVKKATGASADVFKPLNKSSDGVSNQVADTSSFEDAQKVVDEVTESEAVMKASADLSKALSNAVPERTVKAYKLFRTNPNKPGEFFPLFVNADRGVPTGQWIDAEVGPLTQKGKVKSKIGELAYRPGWHAGDYASATHIGGKSRPGLTKPDYRPANQVWAEVELPDDVDWQSIANSRASTVKSGPNKGQMNVKEAHITDQVPFGGHYRYKTNSNMQGNWLIGGSMKVNRPLSAEEVLQIQKQTGIDDLPSLPELIDRDGLQLSDLNQEAVKELRTYYPDKYAEMAPPTGLFSGGLVKYEFESEEDMTCGMMAPDLEELKMEMTVGTDPVSGNPIPPGSGAHNVRDDIPAVLSDGEYVVPADVVRYHGLKTFMELRDEAKMGLMAMYAEGQIRPITEEMTEEAPEDDEDDVEDDEEDTSRETPEGNVVEMPEVEAEVETMDVDDEEDDEYATEDVYGDEELIKIFMMDPKSFKRV